MTRRPRRVAILLLTGFLAFAPPGTLLVTLVFLLGFMRRSWLLSAVVAGLGILMSGWLLYQRKYARRRSSRES